MKRIPQRLTIAVLTFAIGIGISWIAHSRASTQRTSSRGNGSQKITAPSDQPVLEMVFVLDTTGSMSGLLEGAKQRIWGIVNEVMQQPSHPAVRIGLVAFRDNGDAYVTQVTPLTDDLDKIYSTLMDFRAEGGGDTPENVRRALSDGVHRAGWSQPRSKGASLAQILFLVGDAPPHDDYQNEPDTLTTTRAAIERGMIVNTIQCGEQGDTRQAWQSIAQRGEGQYFAIAQDGGVMAIASPYDGQITELGAKLGSTFTAFGGGGGEAGERTRLDLSARQAAHEEKVAASAPAPAAADRAYNKALNSNAYAGDLLQGIENNSVKLDSVKDEDLPSDLRKLSVAERKSEIERRLEQRRKLRSEIVTLSKQRDEFVSAERKKAGGAKQSGFDVAVAGALKAQLSRKGIK